MKSLCCRVLWLRAATWVLSVPSMDSARDNTICSGAHRDWNDPLDNRVRGARKLSHAFAIRVGGPPSNFKRSWGRLNNLTDCRRPETDAFTIALQLSTNATILAAVMRLDGETAIGP